ncbi:unnamed protein product [Aphanomyces euteiches]
MEDSWLQDLHLLIATDDQLQEELANVCEILDEDIELSFGESPSSSPLSHEPRPTQSTVDKRREGHEDARKETVKRQRSYIRQRDEIHHLRQQVDQLTAVLKRKARNRQADISLWERTAREEFTEKTKSMEENKYLRVAIYQNSTFIDQMQRVFLKKPRLTSHIDVHSEEWKYYKLAAQSSLREAAIHAIADRQYHRMQSALVKADVFDRDKPLFIVKAIPHADRSYLLEAIHGHTHIDPNTVYSTCMQERNGMTWHSNMVRKYYVELDCEVIVSRTVFEDAALPHMTKGAIEDRCIWLIVKPLPNELNRCRFTYLQHLFWPKEEVETLGEDVIAEVLAYLNKISFQFLPTRPGQLPLTTDLDYASLPFPKMAAFVERGTRFSDTLKTQLNDVIQQFNDQCLM